MLVKDDHLVSLQFHPELTPMFMDGYIDECYANHDISAQEHNMAKSEISSGTDAEIMAKWIAHFFNH